jgi:hypothetical protein
MASLSAERGAGVAPIGREASASPRIGGAAVASPHRPRPPRPSAHPVAAERAAAW